MKPVYLMESLVVISMAYLSYITAELFHMSGILAITFCGITMKNYVEKVYSSVADTDPVFLGHPDPVKQYIRILSWRYRFKLFCAIKIC